jgi:hypothetical protein
MSLESCLSFQRWQRSLRRLCQVLSWRYAYGADRPDAACTITSIAPFAPGMGDGCWPRTCHPWFSSARAAASVAAVTWCGWSASVAACSSKVGLISAMSCVGWRQELPVDLADGAGDGEVGQVHRDQVHWFGDEVRAELGQVGALQVDDPGVGAQPPAELAGAGIDGVDAGRPSIEQGLGEAAGRGAQVERDSAGGVNPEDGEGAGELDRPPQRARMAYLDGSVRAHACVRAGRGQAVDQD